jgi:hypothetical protein
MQVSALRQVMLPRYSQDKKSISLFSAFPLVKNVHEQVTLR